MSSTCGDSVINKTSIILLGLTGSVAILSAGAAHADLTYYFAGTITSVSENENNVIPGLQVGDPFTGYTTFDETGWSRTSGVVFANLNGVDLLFDGQYIYGEVAVNPGSLYDIRIAADTGGDIGASSFSAGNFGPDLVDTDGSAGHSTPFPTTLNLAEFENNEFKIWGRYIPTGDDLFTTGELTYFSQNPVPESVPGDLSGDGDIDDEDLGLFFSAFTGPDEINKPLDNPAADLSGDGDVDDEDLGLAFSQFTGPLGPANVPEPASLVLLVLGTAGLGARRRRPVDV